MKQRKKELIFFGATVMGCLAAMTVVVIAALLIYDRLKEKTQREEAVEAVANVPVISYSEEEVNLMIAEAMEVAENQARQETSDYILNAIRAGLESGGTTVETLRPLYPNDIVIVSNGLFHFIPIRDDLKKHELQQENLQWLENGELVYTENGEVTSHKGIDVSRYQGNIDWNKVADAGVEYAFIRVGIRGYGQEGRVVLDEKFEENIKGAIEAGIKVGVYFFSQAVTDEEALEEANVVLEAISGYDVTYPIVYDVEKTSASDGRMNRLSVEDRTRMAHIFIDRVSEAGYTPMIYANMEMWSLLINMDEFEDVDKWFAYYSDNLYFPYEYAVWQYTDTGSIAGITGNVDMNISFKEW